MGYLYSERAEKVRLGFFSLISAACQQRDSYWNIPPKVIIPLTKHCDLFLKIQLTNSAAVSFLIFFYSERHSKKRKPSGRQQFIETLLKTSQTQHFSRKFLPHVLLNNQHRPIHICLDFFFVFNVWGNLDISSKKKNSVAKVLRILTSKNKMHSCPSELLYKFQGNIFLFGLFTVFSF